MPSSFFKGMKCRNAEHGNILNREAEPSGEGEERCGQLAGKTQYVTAHDGVRLEITTHQAEAPKALIVLWPCGGGNARLYRFSYRAVLEAGYSIVLYNPRGHGNSQGGIMLEQSIHDLKRVLDLYNSAGLPIIAVGHSVGCCGLLRYETLFSGIKRFFLLSPVLDSSVSLLYMYGKGTIDQFIGFLRPWTKHGDELNTILATRDWMDEPYWRKNSLSERLDRLSETRKIGQFLRNNFIPGVRVYEELESCASDCTIFLPSKDDWFPIAETVEHAGRYGARVIQLPEANDHFFSGGMRPVWKLIAADLGVQSGNAGF